MLINYQAQTLGIKLNDDAWFQLARFVVIVIQLPLSCSSFYGFYLERFYFRNWHGLNDKEPSVFRYAQRTSTSEKAGSPLLEMPSLEYLFAQVNMPQP